MFKTGDLVLLFLSILIGLAILVFEGNHNIGSSDIDICGVHGGDGTSCKMVLEFAGIEENWRLRRALEEYVKLHHRIMDPDDPQPKRYVLVDDEPEAGLGNKFEFMVSAFLFAILSKRALLIDWPEVKSFKHWNAEEIVGLPSMEQMLESPGFDWDLSHFDHRLHFSCPGRTKVYDDRRTCCFVSSANESLGCFDQPQYQGTEEMIQCRDFEYNQAELVILHGWDYFVPNLALNPFYRDRIERLFPDGDIFKPLARFLLRPVASIQKTIDDFKSQHFGNYTVGLQIRQVGINKLNVTQERLFWEAALVSMQEKMLSLGTVRLNVKWFLATDTLQVRKSALDRFPNWIVFRDVRIARDDPQSVIDGLIDLWLLASCDDIVVSAASTYGKVAFGIMGRPPKFVNRNDVWGQKTDWQPCFFTFYNHHCLDTDGIPLAMNPQITDCNYT